MVHSVGGNAGAGLCTQISSCRANRLIRARLQVRQLVPANTFLTQPAVMLRVQKNTGELFKKTVLAGTVAKRNTVEPTNKTHTLSGYCRKKPWVLFRNVTGMFQPFEQNPSITVAKARLENTVNLRGPL